MEWKIGEIKQVNGEWYQCIEQPEKYDKTVCDLCDFHYIGNCELDRCSGTYRSDKKSIIFKKLEKIGEPYEYYVSKKGIIQVQDYLLADPNHTVYNKIEGVYDYLDDKVVIEIKQNKEEGMEEKKVKLSQEEYNYIRNNNKLLLSHLSHFTHIHIFYILNAIMWVKILNASPIICAICQLSL